jgi:hypothetical protein
MAPRPELPESTTITDAGKRVRVPLRVVEVTGEPGDAYVIRSDTFHAAAPNARVVVVGYPACSMARSATSRPGSARASRLSSTPPPTFWDALEPLLPEVTKPAQYVGVEHNQVRKSWQAVETRWLLCYPDTYEVGQPNQGIQILYEVLNERPTTVAERGFAPWSDLEAIMREERIPFFSLENHLPLRAFDVVAFSLAAEVGYTNLLNCLDLGGLPLRSADRADGDPLVVICAPLAIDADAFRTADGDLESSLRLICEKVHAYGDVPVGKA